MLCHDEYWFVQDAHKSYQIGSIEELTEAVVEVRQAFSLKTFSLP